MFEFAEASPSDDAAEEGGAVILAVVKVVREPEWDAEAVSFLDALLLACSKVAKNLAPLA